jgi:hypothetical protein
MGGQAGGRIMRAALAVVATALVIAPIHAAVPKAVNPYAHVRAMQKDAQDLIAQGMAQSPTFRRLVNQIERSDVIVYVDLRPDMRESIGGSLRFLARSATHRFLRVQVNRADAPLWRVALLGHELQHAVEVAEAADIVCSDDMRTLYRRIGVRTGPDAYDSTAARQAGYTVRDELVASRGGNLRLARLAAARPVSGGEALGDDGAREATARPARDDSGQ